MWSNEDAPLACVSRSGSCPVRGCEEDGECYLWRCANPHAPAPVKDDEEVA